MGWSMDWVHGPGPWGGPCTRSMGWFMDPGPCFVYVPFTDKDKVRRIKTLGNDNKDAMLDAKVAFIRVRIIVSLINCH